MTIQQLQSFLLWCAAINYGVLILVFVAWVVAGDALYRLHARWFRLERAQVEFALYLMLGFYKLGVWLFCLVPWLALQLLRS